MPNRLAAESSPYLLQHAQNPVDWYPWGPEALERAKSENRPVFLSIGYSACHWCHVMEHESFENEEIARLLNESFVCIKVDREERPDLDQIYMNAVQLLSGRGGWPMSVFLTPDLQPFYGGTYWPPYSRMGMPGFDQVIRAVADAWENRREQACRAADEITRRLQRLDASPPDGGELDPTLLRDALATLERIFDFQHGGFGSAPKFPHAMDLQVLLRIWKRFGDGAALEMVQLNLDKMAAGGIYDHLAGGFARYSVDERWLVPHFEKMLYDNALLSLIYLEAFQATGRAAYAQVLHETLRYIQHYMTDPLGGFHSTEDADSEGEEGKFYLWTVREITQILGVEEGERFCLAYDVSAFGNFEGRSILNLPKRLEPLAALRGWDLEQLERELAQSRVKLLAARDRRVRPGKDDKVLTSWNALMIDAFARAAAVFGQDGYRALAERAMQFVLSQLRDGQGRLLHSWRNGKARLAAYLDDYAYLVNALVSLYETTWDERYVDEAVRLADDMLARFADGDSGGFYFTARDHEQLIARTKDLYDSSVPSGNGMAATALIRLGKLTGCRDYLDAAHSTLLLGLPVMRQSPTAAGQLLVALDLWLGPTHEIVILGRPEAASTAAVLRQARASFWPQRIIACRASDRASDRSRALDPLFAGKALRDAEPTVYACENFTCQAPVAGAEAAATLLASLAKPAAG